MKNYSRVCARINLDAIEYNMDRMKENLADGVKMISVIKSDGYGHGALQIARFLEAKEYIWGYALAALDEAGVLKRSPFLCWDVSFRNNGKRCWSMRSA